MKGDTDIRGKKVMDSREVIERIEWLTDRGEERDEDEAEELEQLQSLTEEAEGYSDWRHGATLIRDDYFEDYARELAEDIGSIQKDMAWPCNHIDWEAAAEELKSDYTSVELGDDTYWVRQ